MAGIKDITGQRFGRLTIVSKVPHIPCERIKWNCLCDCGNTKIVSSANLPRTKSCGCLAVAKHKLGMNHKHGMCDTRVYNCWGGMVNRCTNPHNSAFSRYGKRGITVCSRWLDFENFFYDMGHKPTPEHSIERHDNNKGYNPCNCYWATRQDQSNNRRSNKWITHNGLTLTYTQWGEKLFNNRKTIHNRISRLGWTETDAMSIPRYGRRD